MPHECLSIELVGREAVAAVIALIHRVFDEYEFTWEPEQEFWDLLADEGAYPYVAPRGALWVLRGAGGRVVGSVAAERLTGELDGTVELHRLYLDAELRGRGLGRRLLATAEAWARAQGARRVQLWSDTEFQDAHRLYERRGYVKSGQRHLADANDTVEWKYERALSAPAPDPEPDAASAPSEIDPD